MNSIIKKYVNWLVDHPYRVILGVALITLFFAFQLHNLFMILDPKRILPQDHPFVQLNNKIEKTFGGSRVVVIGVSVKEGDIFNPVTLAKIKRITEEVKKVPGILEENVVSIADRKIKFINASRGGMDIRPMMSEVPATREGFEELKKNLFSNDLYIKSLVSEDGKSAAIITDFRSGVLSPEDSDSKPGSTAGGKPWWNPDKKGGLDKQASPVGKPGFGGNESEANGPLNKTDQQASPVGKPGFGGNESEANGPLNKTDQQASPVGKPGFGGIGGATAPHGPPQEMQATQAPNKWWNGEKKGASSNGGTTYDVLFGLVIRLIYGNSAWPAGGENPYWTSDSTIYKKLHAIIDPEKDSNTTISLGGLPVALSFLEADTDVMNGIVFPIAFVIIMAVLFLSFKSLQGMVIPILTALLSVVWALGLVGLLGIPLDPFTKTLTPLLIVAIAAGHSIQILKRYYEEYAISQNHREAVRESTLKMAPVMLTAGLVASASFASLVTFHLKTFQAFGLLTAFGILSAVALELSFIPAFRIIVKPGIKPARLTLSSLDRALASWGAAIPKQKFKILSAGILFLAVSSVGASHVKVNNSLKNQFFEKTELRQSDRAINRAFGGTSTFYILIDGKKADRLKDPNVMAGIEGLQKVLESTPGVGKTQSYVDYLKKMNRSIHGGDPAWEKIPESRQAAAEYLFLYSISGNPADFNRLVNYDYQQAVIWTFLKSDSTDLAERLIKEVEAYKPGHFDSDISVGVAGSSPVTVALNETMVKGKVQNVLQVSGITFVIASLVFRSLLGGLLVLIPVLLAVLINFGVMGFSGLTLGIGTATISAMSVGLGADYAIYFIFRLKEEYQKASNVATASESAGATQAPLKAPPNVATAGKASERGGLHPALPVRGATQAALIDTAIQKTMTTAGKSILYVAFAISAGCATLIFPGYYLHTEGILVPLAMLTSSIGAISLIPALMAWLRPQFVFGEK
ncbi:MAG: efflux RND transporter permease subunit [Nitrospiria bacterium]